MKWVSRRRRPIAARTRHVTHAVAGQHGADEHHRAAQPRAALAIVVAAYVVEVELAGAERVGVLLGVGHLHAHVFEQLDELQYVDDARHVADRNPLGGEQRGAEYLQRLVLGALGRDRSVEPVSALDLKNCHDVKFLPKVRISVEKAKRSSGFSLLFRMRGCGVRTLVRRPEGRAPLRMRFGVMVGRACLGVCFGGEAGGGRRSCVGQECAGHTETATEAQAPPLLWDSSPKPLCSDLKRI